VRITAALTQHAWPLALNVMHIENAIKASLVAYPGTSDLSLVGGKHLTASHVGALPCQTWLAIGRWQALNHLPLRIGQLMSLGQPPS